MRLSHVSAILPDLAEKASDSAPLPPGRRWRADCDVDIGKMPILRPALAALLLAAALPSIAAASTPADGAAFHLRTTDLELRLAIDDGMRESPTFRALVQRLTGSDIIVYVCRWHRRAGADGRLTFVVGGRRLSLCRGARRAQPSPPQLLALLAHELRHAVEVAETPAIVDPPSLAREYARLGYVSQVSGADRIAFDTAAAVAAGHQVLSELQGGQRRRGRRTLAANAGVRGQFGAGTEMNPEVRTGITRWERLLPDVV